MKRHAGATNAKEERLGRALLPCGCVWVCFSWMAWHGQPAIMPPIQAMRCDHLSPPSCVFSLDDPALLVLSRKSCSRPAWVDCKLFSQYRLYHTGVCCVVRIGDLN
jgi:hypothetical protein